MTRYLSLALGAAEPAFGQSIAELERAAGQPSADIRLSSELTQQVRAKIMQLGLDPDDTTGPELYKALHERLRQDEQHVRAELRVSDTASTLDTLSAVHKFLSAKKIAGTSFALKAVVAKKLLKKKLPKNTMKALGYRSFDSMLKHEQVGAIYAAATFLESASWHKAFREQYGKLTPADFEQRSTTVLYPKAKRWTAFAEKYVQDAKHNILCFKELGAVVILPMQQKVEGLSIVTIVLSLHYLNDIRTYSSFIKLQQVKPGYGKIIAQTSYSEPMTSADLAGQPVPWRVIQKFYGRMAATYHPDVFEPHVQPEDLAWRDAEDVLAGLSPELAFWKDTAHVCALHQDQPVSLNILDVVLSYCNNLHFTDRIVHFVRTSLWHELMSRYLHQGNLEAAVQKQLGSDMVEQQALAEF